MYYVVQLTDGKEIQVCINEAKSRIELGKHNHSIASYPGRLQTWKKGLVLTVSACVKTPRFVGYRISTCTLRIVSPLYVPHTHVYRALDRVLSNHAAVLEVSLQYLIESIAWPQVTAFFSRNA